MSGEPNSSFSQVPRRSVLLGGAALLAGVGTSCTSSSANAPGALAFDGDDPRRERVFNARQGAAALGDPIEHIVNGDEETYPDGKGSFRKTLVHDELGGVTEARYTAFVDAVESGDREQIEALESEGFRTLADPIAAHGINLIGADPQTVAMPVVHTLASERQAAEAIEVYWKALLRDLPFSQWSSSDEVAPAIEELTALDDFTAPRQDGNITAQSLFRGQTPGDLDGPYISQFLLQDVPHSLYTLQQVSERWPAGTDFMTSQEEWLAVQNGNQRSSTLRPSGTPRVISTGRDLAQFVHGDYSFQAYFQAALICLNYGPNARSENIYEFAERQGGFINYGGPDILDLVARSAAVALRVAWFHKWLVHRKIRPEALGGLVDHHLEGRLETPLSETLLNSTAVERTQSLQGTALLSQAYPEGSPTHPSYPAGHACVAGAGVTVLKAHFDETFEVHDPVTTNDVGEVEELGSALLLGGELNKLASNMSIGRNIAGVHWRADGDDGMVAGEAAAISLLQDHLWEVPDQTAFYELTKFDGTQIRITKGGIEEEPSQAEESS